MQSLLEPTPTEVARQQHVVVVGAGPGGLAAALLLRQAGLDVTVVEQKEDVGGRTRVIEREGYKFDLGPTFLMYLPAINEVFQAIGRDIHEELDLIKLDPQYRLTFGIGGHLDATPNMELMHERITELAGVDNANAFMRWMEDNREKLERSEPCIQSPWESPVELGSKRARRVAKVLKPTQSVAKQLDTYFTDQRMHLACSFQSKYLGMSPFSCPSLFTILAFIEYEHGVWHPIGGLGRIPARMAEIATEMGVNIRTSTPVRQLIFDGKRATGVALDGGEALLADAVVMNADFAHAMTTLVPDHLRKRWTDKKLDSKKYSCSTYMLYLGVEGRYDDVQHHQVYISANYEENLKDIDTRHQLTWDDPSVYVQNASVTDPTLAPEGHSTLYVLVPVTHLAGTFEWTDALKLQFREVILDQMEQKMGYHDIRSRIRSETCITPKEWELDGSIYRGATFNLAHNLGQMLHLRPHNRFEDLENVYIVGGGTHPGSGLPTIFESAKISSKLLLADLEQPEPDWHGVPTWFPDMRAPKAWRMAQDGVRDQGGQPSRSPSA